MASLVPNGEQVFLDGNGNPLAFGTVDMFIPGTVTPKVTWKDELKLAVNTQPIVLDIAGRAIIWGEGSYRQIVRDFAGGLIWDRVVTAEGGGSGNNTAIFNTVAEFKAASLSTAITAVIIMGYHIAGDGGYMRLQTVATEPTHPGKFFAHARHWEYAKMPYNVVMFDSQTDAAAASEDAVEAAFRQRVVFSATAGDHILKINPKVESDGDDVIGGKLFTDACHWASSCQITSEATLQVFIDGQGEHKVWGQVNIDDFSTVTGIHSIWVTMAAGVEVSIPNSPLAVNYVGNRHGYVTHITIDPVGSVVGGTGYTSPPTITIVGGVGTGATAIAEVANGQVSGIKVTNRGSGYIDNSTVDVEIEGGGGTGAKATAFIADTVWDCTVTLAAWPAATHTPVVGMPVGIAFALGTNDAGAINGAHKLTGVNAAAKTITFEMNGRPATKPLDEPAPMIDGSPVTTEVANKPIVHFPATWLNSTGGYSGAGSSEGLFNANGGGRIIKMTHVAARFSGFEALNQQRKRDQCFGTVARDGGAFYFQIGVIAVDFPGTCVRAARGHMYASRCYFGGGIYNTIVIQCQNGGWIQLSNCGVGNTKGQCILSQGGISVYASNCYVGSGDTGLDVQGGYLDCQVTYVHSCRVGLATSWGSLTFMGAGGNGVEIQRCESGIDLTLGGQMWGMPIVRGATPGGVNVTGNIQLGTLAWGGAFMATAPSTDPIVQVGAVQRVGNAADSAGVGLENNHKGHNFTSGKLIFSSAPVVGTTPVQFRIYNNKVHTGTMLPGGTDERVFIPNLDIKAWVQYLGSTGSPTVLGVKLFKDPVPNPLGGVGFIYAGFDVKVASGGGNTNADITICYEFDRFIG